MLAISIEDYCRTFWISSLKHLFVISSFNIKERSCSLTRLHVLGSNAIKVANVAALFDLAKNRVSAGSRVQAAVDCMVTNIPIEQGVCVKWYI